MNIYEVGPRDGLQSAAVKLSTEEKLYWKKMNTSENYFMEELGLLNSV